MSFSPNKDLVKQQYFKLSRKYHPDFVSNGTDEEKEQALQTSSLINNAYKIFNNPDETIKYILQLKGLIVDEEKYVLPNDFLMDMMELNEKLMDAKMEANLDLIDACKLAIKKTQQNIYDVVKEIIENDNEFDFSEKKLLLVKDYYFKKKYLNRILDGID